MQYVGIKNSTKITIRPTAVAVIKDPNGSLYNGDTVMIDGCEWSVDFTPGENLDAAMRWGESHTKPMRNGIRAYNCQFLGLIEATK